MIKYTIKQDINNVDYQKLYDDYFPEKSNEMTTLFTESRVNYFICAIENEEVVGVMGINNYDTDYYRFLHLVVNESYTGQGVATGIIRTAVKFLIELGATKIQNHKRENIIPHTIFTDMGFELTEYNEKELEYKWVYELDTTKAINMWTQYKGI